jgi:ParB-like chromosome segregation protein Spo0J
MPTLWAAAEGKPQVSVPLAELNILDDVVWFGGPKAVQPTIRKIAERARDIFAADLGYPIIMTAAGEVLDGAHRIARAYLQGQQTISAIVIDDWPEPDGYVDKPAPKSIG